MTALQSLNDPFTVATKHWHRLDDGRIQCDVCPRACKLHEGQRGLCFVRGRIDDQVKLTSYGRSSGFCVDPIEKKPLNHFLPGTPGIQGWWLTVNPTTVPRPLTACGSTLEERHFGQRAAKGWIQVPQSAQRRMCS